MLPTKFNWMGKKQKNKNISDVCYLPIIWLVNTLFFSLPTQYVRSLPHWRKTSPTCYPATTMDVQRGFFISHRTRNYENKLSVLCNADIGHGIMINTYSKNGKNGSYKWSQIQRHCMNPLGKRDGPWAVWRVCLIRLKFFMVKPWEVSLLLRCETTGVPGSSQVLVTSVIKAYSFFGSITL